VQVHLGGLDGLVAQPKRDDAAVHSRLQEPHGRCVPERVGSDVLVAEGRTAFSGSRDLFRHQALDGVRAHGAASRAGEDGRVGTRRLTGARPGFEDSYDIAA